LKNWREGKLSLLMELMLGPVDTAQMESICGKAAACEGAELQEVLRHGTYTKKLRRYSEGGRFFYVKTGTCLPDVERLAKIKQRALWEVQEGRVSRVRLAQRLCGGRPGEKPAHVEQALSALVREGTLEERAGSVAMSAVLQGQERQARERKDVAQGLAPRRPSPPTPAPPAQRERPADDDDDDDEDDEEGDLVMLLEQCEETMARPGVLEEALDERRRENPPENRALATGPSWAKEARAMGEASGASWKAERP